MSNPTVKCEVCGRSFYRITNTHLATHDFSLLDYQLNYPNAPLLSDWQREEIKDLMREYCATEEGKETKRRVVAERLKDPNDGYFGSEVISQRNRDNWADPEYKRRVSDAIGKAKSTPEQRRQISETSSRNWEDPEYARKVREGREGIGFGQSVGPNEEEGLLERMLNRVNPGLWKYNSEGIYVGRKRPDFIHTSKKKLIEYFGLMWHIPVLDDKEVTEYYKGVGYEVLIVWDRELLSFKDWDKLEERLVSFEQI